MRLPLLALLIAIAPSCTIELVAKATFPQNDVALVTDTLGITHVIAESDGDAMYGSGYAQARDRLFQMELVRRQMLGTQAEILGADFVKADLGARAFDFMSAGKRDEERLRKENPGDATLVDAWVAGVNARIDEVRRGTVTVPYGFGKGEHDFIPDPWTTAQALGVGKVYAFGLSSSLEGDLLSTALSALAPDAQKTVPFAMPAFDVFPMGMPMKSEIAPHPPIYPMASPITDVPLKMERVFPKRPLGSNNWAVAGSLTDNGKPYVCGDPHQSLTSPSRLWPSHMRAKSGSLDAIGFSFVGTPSIQLGHGAHVGWTATTNFADAMDILDVTVDPDFTKVTLADGDHPITTRKITIAVKNGMSEDHDLYDVPGVGILLPEPLLPLPRGLLAKGGALLLMWTGFDATLEVSAYLGMDRAKSLDEFDAAVDKLDVGAANFIAADSSNIGYRVHARIPDRGVPSSHPMPFHVVSGADPLALWTHGNLGPDKLPHLRNPANGFLLTANNDPWGFTADGSVENDAFYYGTYYATGMRAKRIDDALSALATSGKKIARADMENLQRDTTSVLAPVLLDVLADAIGAVGTDAALAAWASRDDLKALAAALAAWDRSMSLDAGEPIVWDALVGFAMKRTFEPVVMTTIFNALAGSPELYAAALANAFRDRFPSASLFPNGKRVRMMEALDDTAAWLKMRFGSTDPKTFKLGDVQTAEFDAADKGKLEVMGAPKGGGFETIDVSNVGFFDNGVPRTTFVTKEAALYRMVIGFGADGVPEATFDTARGASGDPDSPHFGDLQKPWVDRQYVSLPFRQADIDAKTEVTVTLKGLQKK